MYSTISLSESKEEIPGDLLCHKTIITEVRDNNSWDIDCSCKAFLPRTSENPWDKQGTRYNQDPARTPPEERAINKETATRAETPKEIGRSNMQLAQNDAKGTLKKFLKTVHIVHGWEASASKYPGCRNTHLVKQKISGHMPTAMYLLGSLWEEKAYHW